MREQKREGAPSESAFPKPTSKIDTSTPKDSCLGPFAEGAQRWRDAGWEGTIPVGNAPGEKYPPAPGFTGNRGAFPTDAEVEAWIAEMPELNPAIRLPEGVIGIDVDAYGEKRGGDTLREIEAAHGLLPRTWISTARHDGESGIRLLRLPGLPPGSESLKLPGVAGPGIEIIQHSHRYMVASPSVHPEGGRYRLISPDGEEVTEPPRPEDLPELPKAWLDHLLRQCSCFRSKVSTPAEVGGDPVQRQLDRWHLATGSRHDAALEATLPLVAFQEKGWPGAQEALEEVRTGFLHDVTSDGSRTTIEAEAEWDRMIEGALELVPESAIPVYVPRSSGSGSSDLDSETSGMVDLLALMSGEAPSMEWLCEPVIPAGKLVGITARRGDGKSLFALGITTAIATGRETLDQPAGPPRHVLYVDYEMSPEDVYDRLSSFGFDDSSPDLPTLAEHLHYALLPDLPPLDTEAGGEALMELVDRYGAELVVIDTVSRVISGAENDAEPFRELFRHTERRLKKRGVTLLRIDHLGKDAAKGSRGSSAKEDPLDVVWQLKTSAKGVTLTRTKGRQDSIPQTVEIERIEQNGTLRFETPQATVSPWLIGLVHEIDALGLPDDAPVSACQKALRDAGKGRRKSDVADAARVRRRRVPGNESAAQQRFPASGTAVREPRSEPLGTDGQKGPLTRANRPGTAPGPAGSRYRGRVPTPLVGTGPNPAKEDPSEEGSGGDLDDLCASCKAARLRGDEVPYCETCEEGRAS